MAGLVTRSGLRLVTVEGLAVCYSNLGQADRVFPLRRAAAQASADGLISELAATTWIGDLAASSTSGEFLLSITLFTVVATKP